MSRAGNASRSSRPRLERWFGLLPARWRRVADTPSAGKPPPPAPESRPSAPLVPPPSPPRAFVLVTVLGLSRRALDEVLKLVAKEAETKPIVPVFITDDLDFAPFRKRRLRFEYLPDRDRQQRFAPDLDWDLYLRRRYALLSAKWQAKSTISFGRPPPREGMAESRPAGGKTEIPTRRINGTEGHTTEQGHHEVP
jgi:hypothetical protein